MMCTHKIKYAGELKGYKLYRGGFSTPASHSKNKKLKVARCKTKFDDHFAYIHYGPRFKLPNPKLENVLSGTIELSDYKICAATSSAQSAQ